MTPDKVIRYVVTHVVQRGENKGTRTLSFAAQGRNTYAKAEEAQRWIDSARKNNSAKLIAEMYGDPDTLRVRPVECWPGHFDPKGIWFDM